MENRSIHPHVRLGGVPKDTSKTYKSGGGKLAKKQARLAKRRLEHSATLKGLPSTIPPGAFKTPGSMNQHK